MKLIIDIDETSYEWLKNTIRPDVIKNYDEIHEAVRKGKPLQTELEEINAEIKVLLSSYGYLDMQTNNDVLEIIDNHIAELKGE